MMDAEAHRHINTTSDSELLLNIFADNLQQTGKFRINEEDIFKAIGGLMEQARGAYACVAMLAGFGLIAFRDPNGIRPLGMATRRSPAGVDYLFASESVVADAAGFSGWEDVRPGEAIIATRTSIARRQVSKPATFAPDIFEYVYFARPDSVLDGVSVYRSRMAMGDALADEVKRVLSEHKLEVDVVIPVGALRVQSMAVHDELSGPGYISCGRSQFGTEAASPVPGGLRQEPICGSDVHHAWAGAEVSRAHGMCHCFSQRDNAGKRTCGGN
jgi:glutamine phosphoribosylpyrophosphate amidotransferase